MCMLSVIAATLICLPARQGQLDGKVSLSVPAMPASKALKALSDAAHVQLTTSLQTANEILTFRFQNVPTSAAMERIAQAVDGSWKKVDDGFQLVRSSEQSRQERSKEFAEDVAEFRLDIDKQAAELKKREPWSPSFADRLAGRAKKLI